MIPLPPRLDDLPAGTRLLAGLGHSTVIPDLDFESFSSAGFIFDAERNKWTGPPNASQGKKGLSVVGAAVYTEHPSCEVLSLAYDLKDGCGKQHWTPGFAPPAALHAYIRTGGLLEAWNVGFERWVWENVCVPRYGWPPVHPSQWRCAMAKARAHALPGALDKAGEVLALAIQKDKDGKRLLDKFSIPRNPTKTDPRTRIRLHEDPADALRLFQYNVTDIASEAEASSVIPDLSPAELRYWQDDQAINRRGMQVDVESIHNCIAIIEQAQRRYGEELQALAGCAPTELQQLKGWLHGRGVHLDSMDEDAVTAALTWNLPPEARRALEIRAAVGSASVKKVFAMRNQVTRAGRLHDLYTYYGARTGRPTGNGPQPTNLPKAGPHVYRCGWHQGKPLASGGCGRHHGAHTMWCHWCGRTTLRPPAAAAEWNPEAMVDALEAISHRSLDWLQILFGDAMLTIAGVLRGLFIAAPGHDLISSDFTAIEGVVIAALAGEQWRLDVYAGTRSIYVESASRAFGVPVAVMEQHKKDTGQHHHLRDKGKRMELGLGFGGWINALRSDQIRYEGTDEELKEAILKWRGASPAIEWLWGGQKKGKADSVRKNAGLLNWADPWDKTPFMFGLEGMAISAVLNPGTEYHVERLNGTATGISYLMRGDVLYCRVPSGGLITYHRPRLEQSDQDWRGLSLSFEGWNTNPKSGPPGWIRMNTYSGKVAENCVQKVARDKQMGAIARAHDAGYPVVMHTYDEITAEVPRGYGSVEHLEQLMTMPEPWNVGWPLKAAGGWRSNRNQKG